jgi:hypothetical protein
MITRSVDGPDARLGKVVSSGGIAGQMTGVSAPVLEEEVRPAGSLTIVVVDGAVAVNPTLVRTVLMITCSTGAGCADSLPPAAPAGGDQAQAAGARAARDKGMTHLGQPVSEHVTLEVVGGMKDGCGPAKLDFVRVLPDGNTENGPGGLGWRVPPGKFLVVTDVDWQYVHPKGAEGAGKIQVLRLLIENLEKPGSSRRAIDSTLTLSGQGQGGVSQSMTSGFVVSSKARLCPDVFPGPLGPPSGLQHLILRGYLIGEK